MARSHSDDKRSAILAAATRVIAAQGLSASTTTLTKEVKVSTGPLFVYFVTKTELLLKTQEHPTVRIQNER